MNFRTDEEAFSRSSDDIFFNLAEQVKLPFVQIAHAAENLHTVNDDQNAQTILVAARAALALIDGYLLSVALQKQSVIQLEPVSLSSVLYDVAQTIDEYGKAYGCDIRIEIGGRYQPVMGHREAIRSALTVLGLSLVESTSHQEGVQKATVRLFARRTSSGIRTGIYTNSGGLSSSVLQRARSLKGDAHQPFGEFSSSNGTGIFIADKLFNELHAPLTFVRQKDFTGMASTLAQSQQLSLV